LVLRNWQTAFPVQDFDEAVGHAGAIVRNTDGTLKGASDPRSDGVAGF
jgi:gamma-glutamyltranspeptidase